MRLMLPLCLTAAILAGCSGQSQAPAPAAAAPAAQPPAAPGPEAIGEGARWNVANARCNTLLAASDDDRAAVGMFYYGYIAARLGFREIEVARIEPNLRRVFEACAANPNQTIAAAFRTLRTPAR